AQVMVTGLCCAVANMLYGAAALLCHPMPSMLSSLLQWPLALPAVIVDVISISLYWCLLFVKALVITELLGLRQFPEHGVLDLVLKQLLTWSAETLTFFCDLRVLGLMALASYFTADHLIRSCFQTGGLRAVLGAWPECPSIPVLDTDPASPGNMMRSLLSCQSLCYQLVAMMSAVLNTVVILLMLKATYLDGRPTPVCILGRRGAKPELKKLK
ncbi:unnamed protein product, partial [Polarella glacialis]